MVSEEMHCHGLRVIWKNRRQFLTYNGVSSDTKILQCGVPQGSIIGPLSDHDFYNITLASPTTDYKDERMNE